MRVFGSKTALRIFRGHFLGCKSMDFSHTLGSVVLAVADVAYGPLFSLCLDGNKKLRCAFCDGNK